MHRSGSITLLLTGLAVSGVSLYPVIASDLGDFEFTDPLDLVLPQDDAKAIELSPSTRDLETSIEEPELLPQPVARPEPSKPAGPVVVSTYSGEAP